MRTLFELTNLLPPERIRATRRGYFFRFGIVALFVLAGVVLMSGALILPSYFFARQQAAEKQAEVDRLTARLAGSEEQAVQARVKALTASAERLASLKDSPKASTAIASLVRLPRPGIRITGFAYAAPMPGGTPRMTVSGVADDRDALRRYVSLLGSQPFVESADLPISAYAKEASIDFTITLTGSLMPKTP